MSYDEWFWFRKAIPTSLKRNQQPVTQYPYSNLNADRPKKRLFYVPLSNSTLKKFRSTFKPKQQEASYETFVDQKPTDCKRPTCEELAKPTGNSGSLCHPLKSTRNSQHSQQASKPTSCLPKKNDLKVHTFHEEVIVKSRQPTKPTTHKVNIRAQRAHCAAMLT